MSTSIHHEAEIWAAAAATGGLTETELKAWSDHLAVCPACQKLNDEELAMSQLIQRTLDPESPDPGFEQRIIHRLNQARARKEDRWYAFLLFNPALTGAAAALALLVIAAAGVLFHGRKPPSVASAVPTNLAGLPASVRSAIQHQADGKTVSNIERNEGDGQVSYTVSTKAPDATESGFTVAEDGTLLSV
jgi:anti-sigma factor ChrR (cupin superfamily)